MGDIADMYRDQSYEDDWRVDALRNEDNKLIAEEEQRTVIRRRTRQGIWTQQDGTPIAVKDMSDRHLLNAYRLLLRKGFAAELEQGFDAPVSPFVDLFEAEIAKRGLKV